MQSSVEPLKKTLDLGVGVFYSCVMSNQLQLIDGRDEIASELGGLQLNLSNVVGRYVKRGMAFSGRVYIDVEYWPESFSADEIIVSKECRIVWEQFAEYGNDQFTLTRRFPGNVFGFDHSGRFFALKLSDKFPWDMGPEEIEKLLNPSGLVSLGIVFKCEIIATDIYDSPKDSAVLKDRLAYIDGVSYIKIDQ